MEPAWSRRLRWRRRGAWMWPAFIAATLADGLLGWRLPWSGDAQSLGSSLLIALFANLIGVVVLCWPLGLLVRRARRDMPAIVARDYAGTGVVLAIGALLALAGLVHHASVLGDRRALQDAIVRAQAFIGDRAPDEFRRNLQWVDMFAIQSGSLYRACVPSRESPRTYCVIVNTQLPLDRSVRFAGYEPNQTFALGVN